MLFMITNNLKKIFFNSGSLVPWLCVKSTKSQSGVVIYPVTQCFI